nr:type II toxin-antitoxin system RelB/DinJ family antitoxin [Massilistercora timonensis]
MAIKNANVTARVEQDVKDQAETILNSLGVSVSSFINMAYRQVILHRGIPFSITIPSEPKTLEALTKNEFDKIMETGLRQAKSGESLSVDDAFNSIMEKLG